MATSNLAVGTVDMQSTVTGLEGGISSDKIDQLLDVDQTTGKTVVYCFRDVLSDTKNVSISIIATPVESLPEIAKRSERKRR